MKHRHTSREAYDSMAGALSGALDIRIMRQLRRHTPAGGVICEHIETALGRKHQSVSGNLRHLVEGGLAAATSNHGTTSSGRRAIKWIITPFGARALQAAEAII